MWKTKSLHALRAVQLGRLSAHRLTKFGNVSPPPADGSGYMSKIVFGAIVVAFALAGCKSESAQNKDLVEGCDAVLVGFEHCFPRREDVTIHMRDSFRANGKSPEELESLAKTCRIEAARLAKECP